MHKTSINRQNHRFACNGPIRAVEHSPAQTHMVTLSLADALPRDLLGWVEAQSLMQDCLEKREGLNKKEVPPTGLCAFNDILDDFLDAGRGSCALAQPKMAELIAAALAYSDGCAYDLKAWCVMPNHVHAVLSMRGGQSLPSVVFAWKRFTAQKARRLVRTEGDLWRREFDDRTLLSTRQVAAAVEQVAVDPARAGLASWPWVWNDRNSIDAVMLPDYAAESTGWLAAGSVEPSLRNA